MIDQIKKVIEDEGIVEKLADTKDFNTFSKIMNELVKRFPGHKSEITAILLTHVLSIPDKRVAKVRKSITSLAEALNDIGEAELEHGRKVTGLDSDLQVEAKQLYDACKAYCVHYNQIR